MFVGSMKHKMDKGGLFPLQNDYYDDLIYAGFFCLFSFRVFFLWFLWRVNMHSLWVRRYYFSPGRHVLASHSSMNPDSCQPSEIQSFTKPIK